MSIRTDMAVESFSQAGGAEKLQGVKVKNKVIENARLEVTDITIETQEAAEKLGRPVGQIHHPYRHRFNIRYVQRQFS